MEQLALYYYETCPYCVRVLDVIQELGLDVELRNIIHEPAYRDELVAARGRSTVPVLRLTAENKDQWMPESRDIIRYLRDHVR